MSSVPLSMKQLEEITVAVSRNLLESWAIGDRFNEDQMDEAAKHAVDDTVFVINNFMEYFNELMLTQSQQNL
jgi:hypothetical protein